MVPVGRGQSRAGEAVASAVTRARRRLAFERATRRLGEGILVAASAAALAILLDRLLALGAARPAVFALLGASAVLYALLLTLTRDRLRPLGAALAVDERLALRERVATALWLAGRDQAPADLRAAIARDAARALADRDLAESFPLRPAASLRWSAVPVAAALALGLLLPHLDLLGRERGARREALEREALRKLERSIAERARTLARKAEDRVRDQESREIFRELERLARPELGRESPRQREREAVLAELSRLEDRVREQEARYRGVAPAPIPRDRTRSKAKTPDAALREALAARDFQAARQALAALRDRLRAAKDAKGTTGAPRPGEGRRPSEEEFARIAKALDAIARKLEGLEKLSALLEKLASSIGPEDLDGALADLAPLEDELERLERLAGELAMLEELARLLEEGKLELASLPREFCPQCGKPFCPFCGKPTCTCGNRPGGT